MEEILQNSQTLFDTLPNEMLEKIAGSQHEISFSYDTRDKDGRFLVIKIGDVKIRIKLLVYTVEDIERYSLPASSPLSPEDQIWRFNEFEYQKRLNDCHAQNTLMDVLVQSMPICKPVSAYFDRTRISLNPADVITIETDTFSFTLPSSFPVLRSLQAALTCAKTEIEDSDD